ncbi:LysR family transcriptional regulator [Paenibacillus validus]|uniref:LysR family transcriptional regulator n=1 Tax=Paenibacillus validus TaxID=44253 RepID=A0A7X2Z952_9BACL|nr:MULTISPECIES: LysR family transcriptional regulator [Paenibacillus]MED4599799.1 LysR family transcriptional regulator [Paenibacillus validus]MED4604671.1 LysR family transcriptional regulator [Paenibacillus validus]MUG70649.1 LysR family transcriptional regulator [Paenibacillus validus]
MELRHLQYIAEIVRCNNFTRAAENLNVTQPTISKMIQNLEKELNADIFVRSGRQIQLTDVGEAILQHSGPILQMFESLKTEINDLTFLNKGSIRIGLPPMAGSSFFPDVIKKFQDRYPGITMKMVEDGASKIERSIEEGLLDVGILLWPVDQAVFDSFPIVRDQLKVVMHPAHRLADRERIELAELELERFIFFNSHFAMHDRIKNACRSAGFVPRIVSESSQWDLIREMVRADLGIAFLPGTICRLLDPNKVKAISLVSPEIPWQPVMAWRREGYQSLAAREWIAFTKQIFAEPT